VAAKLLLIHLDRQLACFFLQSLGLKPLYLVRFIPGQYLAFFPSSFLCMCYDDLNENGCPSFATRSVFLLLRFCFHRHNMGMV